jgi:hypothetical protein
VLTLISSTTAIAAIVTIVATGATTMAIAEAAFAVYIYIPAPMRAAIDLLPNRRHSLRGYEREPALLARMAERKAAAAQERIR